MSYYNTGFSFNPLGTTGPPEPGEPFPVSHKTTLPEGLSTAHSPRDIAPLSSGSKRNLRTQTPLVTSVCDSP